LEPGGTALYILDTAVGQLAPNDQDGNIQSVSDWINCIPKDQIFQALMPVCAHDEEVRLDWARSSPRMMPRARSHPAPMTSGVRHGGRMAGESHFCAAIRTRPLAQSLPSNWHSTILYKRPFFLSLVANINDCFYPSCPVGGLHCGSESFRPAAVDGLQARGYPIQQVARPAHLDFGQSKQDSRGEPCQRRRNHR